MAFMEWNDSLSVRIDEIDQQHKKLIELLNTLYDAMSEGKGRDVLADIIKELKDYTVYHFGTEEKYLREFNCDVYEEHKAIHDKFVNEVLEFEKKFLEGSLILSIEVATFLKNWVSNHILGDDKKYIECFKANGL